MMHAHTHETDLSMFKTFQQWFVNAPDVGNEYHPDPKAISQTYKEWLKENPQGYICSYAD